MSKHPSKDRASLCLFAYSDGRRCRMPRAADPYLCNYHAGREAEDFARQKIGRNISSAFSGECVSATSLSIALARTLAATAPKQAAIIAYLSQTPLMQAVQHASHEYVQAWRFQAWACFGPPTQSSPPPPPDPPGSQPESGSKPRAIRTGVPADASAMCLQPTSAATDRGKVSLTQTRSHIRHQILSSSSLKH